MTRRLILTNKKLREKKRIMRSLKRWSESFSGFFPDDLTEDERYWNMKIPVDLRLIEGKQTEKLTQARCAQYLIDAAFRIYQAKPDEFKDYRVTCVICLPNMFSSEICIYTSEEYFQYQIASYDENSDKSYPNKNHSLSKRWNLNFPPQFGEKHVREKNIGDDDKEYVFECTYFGEVS